MAACLSFILCQDFEVFTYNLPKHNCINNNIVAMVSTSSVVGQLPPLMIAIALPSKCALLGFGESVLESMVHEQLHYFMSNTNKIYHILLFFTDSKFWFLQ